MMDIKGQLAVFERQKKQKADILEELKKIPIIEHAAKRANVGRTTFYRWKTEDKFFSKAVSEAMKEGFSLINDLAESQILSLMKDKHFGASTFWLKYRHPAYATKLKIDADISMNDEELTPEQAAIVKKALKLASFGKNHDNKEK